MAICVFFLMVTVMASSIKHQRHINFCPKIQLSFLKRNAGPTPC